MDFYFRENGDQTCDVICLNCFQVVGTARSGSDIQQLRQEHRCPQSGNRHPQGAPNLNSRLHRLKGAYFSAIAGRNRWQVLLFAVFFLYLVPTLIEWAAYRFSGLRFGVIAVGDLTGCIYIAFACKKRLLGVALYGALMIAEVLAVQLHSVSIGSLVYLMDAAPSVIAWKVLRGIGLEVGEA